MSILTPLSLLATLVAQPGEVKKPQIIEAALYKNGYSAVVRQVQLDADGETMIEGITPAVTGTFWVYGSPGLRIDQLINTTVTDKTEVVAGSLIEWLALNVGAQAEVVVANGSTTEKLSGKLVAVNQVVLLDQGTTMLSVPANQILRASVLGTPKFKRDQQISRQGLRVRHNGAGTLYLLSVEPGLDWTPMYWVDLVDQRNLKITMRTSVANEMGDLNQAELSFVAGAPNMPFLGSWDPFTLIQFAQQPGGRAGSMQNAAPMTAGMADGAAMRREAFDVESASGDSIGELFFYKSRRVDLKRGERGYMVLWEAQSTYTTVYTLSVPEEVSEDQELPTWQTVKFKNTSGVPLTTAVATAYRSQQLVGQDELKYTPAGAEARIRLARAVDIPATGSVSELASEPLVIDNVTRQRVTRKGTIDVQNMKSEEVTIEVDTSFEGSMLTVDQGGVDRKLAVRLNALNPRTQIRWTIKLKPGEKRTLSYTYVRVI